MLHYDYFFLFNAPNTPPAAVIAPEIAGPAPGIAIAIGASAGNILLPTFFIPPHNFPKKFLTFALRLYFLVIPAY